MSPGGRALHVNGAPTGTEPGAHGGSAGHLRDRATSRGGLRNPALHRLAQPRMTARLIAHREANYSGPREPVFASDIKQIQTWLGHADAAFTLRTYVHLPEEGVGSADFLDDAIDVGRRP